MSACVRSVIRYLPMPVSASLRFMIEQWCRIASPEEIAAYVMDIFLGKEDANSTDQERERRRAAASAVHGRDVAREEVARALRPLQPPGLDWARWEEIVEWIGQQPEIPNWVLREIYARLVAGEALTLRDVQDMVARAAQPSSGPLPRPATPAPR